MCIFEGDEKLINDLHAQEVPFLELARYAHEWGFVGIEHLALVKVATMIKGKFLFGIRYVDFLLTGTLFGCGIHRSSS